MVRRGLRGNRGRGRARYYRRSSSEQQNQSSINTDAAQDEVLCEQDKSYSIFLQASTFLQHYNAQNTKRMEYLATLMLLHSKSIQLNSSSKSSALASAWARHDYELANAMLGLPGEKFGLKEVLKAVSILDFARMKRASEKLLRRLQAQGCKKRQKMAKLKAIVESSGEDVRSICSLTSSIIRHIKSWISKIPAERFEFYASHFPKEPWKQLADICHINPKRDVPQCPWFFEFIYGKEIPNEAAAENMQNLTADNISAKVMEADVDYTVAREFKEHLTDAAKERIANYSPNLDTVLWYYEELSCPNLNKVIAERLQNGDHINMSYGKLMERLDMFMLLKKKQPMDFVDMLFPIAEKRLQDLSLCLDAPVVVIGDRSASMDVAIRTSNIIASLLSRIAESDLVFFNNQNSAPPFMPKTVEDVMKLSNKVTACGSTSPAASLYPFYMKKKLVRTFIIVTDEEENTAHEGYRFAELFKKYHDEIYPACLVFISFLVSQTNREMVKSLKDVAPEIQPLCFSFTINRPDLTKLDHVLGVLSLQADNFNADVKKITHELEAGKIADILKTFKL